MSTHPNIPLSDPAGDAGGGYVSVRYRPVLDAGNPSAPARDGRSALKDRGPEERAKLRDLWTKAKAAAHRLWLAAKDEPGAGGADVAHLTVLREGLRR